MTVFLPCFVRPSRIDGRAGAVAAFVAAAPALAGDAAFLAVGVSVAFLAAGFSVAFLAAGFSVAFFAGGVGRFAAFLATAFAAVFFTRAGVAVFFATVFLLAGRLAAVFFTAGFAGCRAGFFAPARRLRRAFRRRGARFTAGAARRDALGARRTTVFLPALPGIPSPLGPCCERAMVLPRMPAPERPTRGAAWPDEASVAAEA